MAASDGHPAGHSVFQEKREAERVPTPTKLVGEVMAFQPMTITEISRGGAALETVFPLQLDSLHDLRFTLGDQPVVLKGRVVHSRIADLESGLVKYHSGVEFVDPPDRAATMIEGFVELLKEKRLTVP